MRLVTSVSSSTVEKITSVQLHPRLRCLDFHGAATGRIDHLGCSAQLASGSTNNKTMIIAVGRGQLSDPLTDLVRRREIQRCAFDIRCRPRRNHVLIDRQVLIAREDEFMVVDGA